MQINERFERLLKADSSTLAEIDRVLDGRQDDPSEDIDVRLLNFSEAARILNLSRTTVWRLVKAKRIPIVELRKGSRRVPMAAIKQLIRNNNKG